MAHIGEEVGLGATRVLGATGRLAQPVFDKFAFGDVLEYGDHTHGLIVLDDRDQCDRDREGVTVFGDEGVILGPVFPLVAQHLFDNVVVAEHRVADQVGELQRLVQWCHRQVHQRPAEQAFGLGVEEAAVAPFVDGIDTFAQ